MKKNVAISVLIIIGTFALWLLFCWYMFGDKPIQYVHVEVQKQDSIINDELSIIHIMYSRDLFISSILPPNLPSHPSSFFLTPSVAFPPLIMLK